MNVNATTTLYRAGLVALILAIAPGAPPQGTVLTGEAAVVLASDFFYNPSPRPAEIWQPNASDIARLEKLLPDFMRSQSALPGDYQPLHQYFRQYVGIVRNGKRFIGVSFIHSSILETMERVQSSQGKSWDFRKTPIAVMDGGAYVFHLQFEPATGSFSNLRFNGYA
jgi:hypothetical protein